MKRDIKKEIVYLDKNCNHVAIELAVRKITREYDSNGSLISSRLEYNPSGFLNGKRGINNFALSSLNGGSFNGKK